MSEWVSEWVRKWMSKWLTDWLSFYYPRIEVKAQMPVEQKNERELQGKRVSKREGEHVSVWVSENDKTIIKTKRKNPLYHHPSWVTYSPLTDLSPHWFNPRTLSLSIKRSDQSHLNRSAYQLVHTENKNKIPLPHITEEDQEEGHEQQDTSNACHIHSDVWKTNQRYFEI